VLVFTVDLATPGRRYSEVHDGMEKDPTLLGMLGFVAQGALHPRWALDLREELRVAMTLTGCSDVNRATPDLLLKD
jgi:isopentenyl diphosphate isomerase/L-lactate dehydrogenase-like FMN-dependent dehydrogenase